MNSWRAWLLRRVHAQPYRYYALLRRFRPIVRVGALNCCVVTRTSDVVRVLTSPEQFSSGVMSPADPYLLGADPPVHTRVRRTLQGTLAALSLPAIRQAAADAEQILIDAVQHVREVDLIEQLAAPVPMFVLASVLGIDPRRHGQFARWSRAVVTESTALPGTRLPEGTRELVAEFDAFVKQLIREREQGPGTDLVSRLLSSSSDDRLTAAETFSIVRLLLIAGNETTTHLIGNALRAMLATGTFPSSDDGSIDRFVEEALRYDPPVQFVMRVTSREVDVAGARLPAGTLVMALLGATGRDPALRPAPHRFDPTRRTFAHLAFGAGPHACPGAWLARMEARIALATALRALPQMTLSRRAGAIVRAPLLQLRGLSHLYVEGGLSLGEQPQDHHAA